MRQFSEIFLLTFFSLAIALVACSCSSPSSSGNGASPGDSTDPGAIPVYTYNVINTFPHSPDAFTQGLVYENGFLYEGTGTYGGSSVRKVELETGDVLDSHTLPINYFGEGITIFEDRIIQLTYHAGKAFIYDKETLDSLDTLYYPNQGWGLTHDGAHLIMSDGTSTLRYWDPVTLEQLDSIQVTDGTDPVSRLNELEFINGEIYANIWFSDVIARISPVTGKVVGWIDLTDILTPKEYPAEVLNGIAYDAGQDRLFVTGKNWPSLFEIELVLVE
jgi:glutamine cyclotransferase